MRTKIITLLSVLLIAMACKKKTDEPPSVFLEFYPRKCNFGWLYYIKRVRVEPNDQVGYILENIENDECRVEDLLFTIYTSSIDTLPDPNEGGSWGLSGPYIFHQFLEEGIQQLDKHNLSLEKQLEDDYVRSLTPTSGSYDYTDITPWEYRTNGIEELTITCNKSIFNQAPGTVLNSYFHISSLSPQQIVSSQTVELLFGCSDNLNKMSITEWLEMKPMAQPSMRLMMNSVPSGLPNDFVFTVKLKTSAGKEIEFSGREIRLLP